MIVHLDPATPAPVGYVPGAGVVLVHQCETAEQRAGCALCPAVTPELAACHAVQALDAAGVEHDPGETWTTVHSAVAEQLAWRGIVAGLAAGDTAAEPAPVPLALALAPSGAPSWTPPAPAWGSGVEQATDRISLPPDWHELTSSVPPANPTRRAAGHDGSWSRLLVGLVVVAVMIGTATTYVVATRPDWAHLPGSTPNVGTPNADTAGGTSGHDLADFTERSSDHGGAGDASRSAGATATNPPTPAPSPSPHPVPSGDVAGRTDVKPPPPAPSGPASSPSQPGPTASSSEPAPSPSESESSSPAPSDTSTPDPTCVLDLTGVCVVAATSG